MSFTWCLEQAGAATLQPANGGVNRSLGRKHCRVRRYAGKLDLYVPFRTDAPVPISYSADMSNNQHALVWIDHQQAKIFQFDATQVNSSAVRSTHPHEHIHHKANSGDSGHVGVDKAFLKRVGEAVSEAAGILITGPAGAKKELAAYLGKEQPAVAAKIVGVEPLDHPSDGELLAFARKFFAPDDRMQASLRGEGPQ